MKKQAVVKEQDPISEAEATLTQVRDAVAVNRAEQRTLTEEAKGLWDEIGKDGAVLSSEKKATRHQICQARIAFLDRELPALEARVTEAEGARDLSRKQAAQTRIDHILGQKDEENERSTALWRELLQSRDRARALQGEANQLAETHGLPRPSRARWLLNWQDIRSDAAEEVRATIDEARVRGVGPGAAGRLEGS